MVLRLIKTFFQCYFSISPTNAESFNFYAKQVSDTFFVKGRLVRLIPASNAPILNFFNHRLPASPDLASSEFFTFLTGTSPLYDPIPTPQALLIRSILAHLHLEIVKRARPPASTFNFQSASIGNLFLTGARLFSGSFEAAIYLLAIIGRVDESRTSVLPAIVSNFTHHISAGLADGTVINGQNAISHPSEPTALMSGFSTPPSPANNSDEVRHNSTNKKGNPESGLEEAHLPGSLPDLRVPNITFSKTAEAPLPARIARIWYINPYGQEMHPVANPKVLEAIQAAEAVIYSVGSLYTSLAPSLILRGVGEAIAARPRYKILLLNSSLDRETPGYTATDFVVAIARACQESCGIAGEPAPANYKEYVTHLIHLEGDGSPAVDREELSQHGIKCFRLYGRREDNAKSMLTYDGTALAQALSMILGKRDPKGLFSRRNTLER